MTTVIPEHKPWNKSQDRQLTIGLMNTSDKTIVAYGLLLTELDADGKPVGRDFGVGEDFLTPDGSSSSHYILAGQPAKEESVVISDERVVSIKVEVMDVVYLDQTYEGLGGGAGAVFDGRKRQAAQIRNGLATESHTPEEKAALEKQAAFYESASHEAKSMEGRIFSRRARSR